MRRQNKKRNRSHRRRIEDEFKRIKNYMRKNFKVSYYCTFELGAKSVDFSLN